MTWSLQLKGQCHKIYDNFAKFTDYIGGIVVENEGKVCIVRDCMGMVSAYLHSHIDYEDSVSAYLLFTRAWYLHSCIDYEDSVSAYFLFTRAWYLQRCIDYEDSVSAYLLFTRAW